jgi:hypothetical protein
MEFQTWHGLCIEDCRHLYNALPRAALTAKGMIMNSRKIENLLALLGALIVLFSVSVAANSALAADSAAIDANLKIEVSTIN